MGLGLQRLAAWGFGVLGVCDDECLRLRFPKPYNPKPCNPKPVHFSRVLDEGRFKGSGALVFMRFGGAPGPGAPKDENPWMIRGRS